MKAVVLTGIRQLELVEVPEPKIERDTDVLVQVKVVGVCGSDVHYYVDGKIGSAVVEYPYRVGHECSGIIADVGKGVTKLKVDDHVAVNPAQSCYKCDQCRMGRENTCRELKFLGTPGQGPGCLCEYIVMPETSLFDVTGKLSLETAAVCEPFTIGVYSIQQSCLKQSDSLTIFGAGPIGLSCLTSAKAMGAGKIFVTEKVDKRMEVARKAGAYWVGNPDTQDVVKDIQDQIPLGVDVAIECAGEQSALDEAVEILRPGGTLVLLGIPRFDRVSFRIDRIRRKELSIINIRRQNRCDEKAIELVASGKADIDYMVTHRFPLKQTKQAFDLVEAYQDGVVKALIEMGQ